MTVELRTKLWKLINFPKPIFRIFFLRDFGKITQSSIFAKIISYLAKVVELHAKSDLRKVSI